MTQEPPLVTGARGLDKVPAHIHRVVVATNAKFRPPPGWRTAEGAAHYGEGLWLVPVEREVN